MISHPFASKLIIVLIAAGVICPWPSNADSGKNGLGVIFGKSAEERLIIWCPWANEPLRNKFLNGAAVKFQQQTGAKLIIVFWNKNDLRERLVEKWRNKKATPDLSYIDQGFKHPQIGNSLLDLNNLNLAPGRDPYWILGDAGGGSKNYLPIEGHETAIFYNKILFFKAGIKLPQGKGNNTFGYTYGGGYGINRHSPRVELAKKFLQFLITPPAAELWTKHVQSPYPISLQKWPANSIYGELAAQRRHQTQSKAVEQLFFQNPALNKMWSDLTKKFICGDVSVVEFVQRMNSAF